ncbi:MAG: helix-turn-helix transcriptional regulator, partial [Clostridia bacterium]|nr:helix-turn-helix transcriptional regulator [Clostridia bacterium]
MDYGEKISRLRKSKGITQEELGKVLNVTYQAVSKWERGESQPDFATMSQIAKYFQVPLSYFEDGEETARTEAVSDGVIGMCTECGKMLKDDEVYSSSPKIICKSCAERQQRQQAEQEEALKRKAEHYAEIQRGSGFDVKLMVCIILAVASYIGLTVFCFMGNSSDRELKAALLLIIPIAVFGCTHAVFDLIEELRDSFEDSPDGYTRNLSLIIGAVFAAINIILFLVLYFSFDKFGYYLVLMGLGAVLSFTFISQFMWGSVVQDIFTCGGFTFKLPGFIFSLTPDSIILMIITKIVLGIFSIIVFIITTIFF